MIEVDGRPFEGIHVAVVRGNDLSWNDEGQCLQVGGKVEQMEVTPTEFNAMMTSGHLLFMQAITTAKHDSVLVFGDYDWAEQ